MPQFKVAEIAAWGQQHLRQPEIRQPICDWQSGGNFAASTKVTLTLKSRRINIGTSSINVTPLSSKETILIYWNLWTEPNVMKSLAV